MTKTRLQAGPAMVRADADEREEEKREDASAGVQPSVEIMDAVTKCMDAVERMADSIGKRLDRQDARMDALEGEKEERTDKRKDEAGEEDPTKPERVAADKRKDNAEDVTEEKAKADTKRKDEGGEAKEEERAAAREDAKRKDEAEGEKKEEAHADSADLASIKAEIARLSEENKQLKRIVPRPMTDADAGALLKVQADAEEVYVELGSHAPAPLVNEDVATFRRRIAIGLQKHSPTLKNADLWAVSDSASFDTLEKVIYADALAAARSPAAVGPGQLRGVTRKSGGHEFTEYYGDSAGWMGDLAFTATRGVGSVTAMMKAGQGR